MEFEFLNSVDDYHNAIQELEKLADDSEFQTSSAVFKKFDVLLKRIEAYQNEHFPLEAA